MTLNPSTTAADQLLKLDEQFIGTDNYLGIAYFWNYDYRHYLRDASPAVRVLVHRKFMKYGLSVNGNSQRHDRIIFSIIK